LFFGVRSVTVSSREHTHHSFAIRRNDEARGPILSDVAASAVGGLGTHLVDPRAASPISAPVPLPRRASSVSTGFGPLPTSPQADEGVLVVLSTMQPPLPSSEIARYRTELDQALSQMAELGYLADPSSFHLSPPAPKLLSPPVIEEIAPHRESVKLTFESAYAPKSGLAGSARYGSYSKNKKVEASILRFTDQPRPWLIFLHGFTMGSEHDIVSGGAKKLQQLLGVNVATVPFPFHGHRKVGTRSGERAISADVMDMINSQAQGLSDVRQLMRWIEAEQPGQPIAAYGVSMGAFDLSILTRFEKLDLAIAVAPEWDLADRAIVPLLSRLGEEHVAEAQKAMAPISNEALPPPDSEGSIVVIGAKGDHVTNPKSAPKLAQKLGAELRWVEASHLSALGKAMKEIVQLMKAKGLSRPLP
jgi:predicted alpha/beta hydrolase family esterase